MLEAHNQRLPDRGENVITTLGSHFHDELSARPNVPNCSQLLGEMLPKVLWQNFDIFIRRDEGRLIQRWYHFAGLGSSHYRGWLDHKINCSRLCWVSSCGKCCFHWGWHKFNTSRFPDEYCASVIHMLRSHRLI